MKKRRRRKSYREWFWSTKQRRCHYCGEKMDKHQITADHVKPLSAGGYDRRKNVVACCRPCNALKGSLNRDQFIQDTAFASGHHSPEERKLEGK